MELYHSEELYFGKNQQSTPNKKTYLSEVKKGKTVGSLWDYKEVGSTHEANEELSTILGKGKFDNPKGTGLIKQIIKVANVPSDGIILDSFAGSGTTAHAVLDLNKEDGGNRKFILIECEEKYANTITAERVRRVIKGIPKAKDKNLQQGLGGSFTYCTLGEEITAEKMLTGEHLPSYETLARYVIYTSTGGHALHKIRKEKDSDGFFYESKDRLYYLIYEPRLDFLRSHDSALNMDRAERITQQVKKKKKKAIVYAACKYIGQKDLSQMGITFCLLPYEVLGTIGIQ